MSEWTADDTYDRLMEQEVIGSFSRTVFTTTSQTVCFYEYVINDVFKRYCIAEADLPANLRGCEWAKGWASPSGIVRFR